MENVSDYLNSEKLIQYGGLTLILLLIFLETGFVFGFLFPGDVLLFTAGLLCGTNVLDINIFVLVISVIAAAFSGNLTGFLTGKYFGKKYLAKKDTFFFKRRHLEITKAYYKKYGGASIIAGRFLPVVRTFVPILAGTIDMDTVKFNLYNIAGAVLWVGFFIPTGYFLGHRFPELIHDLEYIVIGVFVVTTFFLVRQYLKIRKQP